MDRPEQILKKISILTDKPISPIVTKDLQQLLLKEGCPLEKSIHLLLMKHRCDLLIYLYENNRTPTTLSYTKGMIKSIRENILSYKKEEVSKFYLLVLSEIDNEKEQLEIGYSNIIGMVLKKPNLETKQHLLWIMCENLAYFFSLRKKKIVVAMCTNFLQIFIKMPMNVTSYVKFINIILQIDHKSKQVFAIQHPEKEEKLEEIFIDLTSRQLNSIKIQLMTLLQKTKEKVNQYGLHKECLRGLKKIAECLNNFKMKEANIIFTQVEIGDIVRILDEFIGRKGLNDEAKSSKNQWMKKLASLQTQKILKTQKILGVPQKPVQSEPMIEDVISLTNNYRLKYEVQPELKNKSSLIFQKNYLKKGVGMGGGRTSLLSSRKQKKQIQPPNKIQSLVDRCFDQYDMELQYRSFPEPQVELPKIQYTQEVREPTELINSRYSMKSSLENDEEVEEISNLIDLAYKYKFS